MKKFAALLFACSALAACSSDRVVDPANFPRAEDGKTDELNGFDPTLSCAAACDDIAVSSTCTDVCTPSDGYCFCDEACVANGDCCNDYQATCGGGEVDGPQALCESTGISWDAATETCACDIAQVFNAELGCIREAQLCDQTGGFYEAGECECAQDGASIDHIFALPMGCINETVLCEQTGGVMEDGNCECAQDGASIHYDFLPEQGGCAYPAFTAIEGVFDAEIGGGAPPRGMVDSELGVYVIHRPGASDVISHFDTLQDAFDETFLAYVEDYLTGNFCRLENGSPEFSCDSDFGDAEGCFISALDSFDRYSSLMTLLNDVELADYSEAEINDMRTLESGTLAEVIVTEQNLSLVFSWHNGGWRLLFVDVARFSCSA